MVLMTFFDFVFERPFRRFSVRASAGRTYYERRPNGIRPTDGRVAQIRIRQVCPSVSRQSSCPFVAWLRTVLDPGLRPTDLPRESERHRNFLARLAFQT